MPKRPQITIIHHYNRGAIRADFGSDLSQAIYKVEESVDVESSVREAIEQVVAGHAPLSHRTIVTTTEVWSQVVSLPRLSVTGIEPEELIEALKFEAETLSGIEIDEIQLAYTPLGRQDDLQRYWVSAIRQADLDAVNAMLESAGCREIVIAHPTGLAGNPKLDAVRNTIEVWEDLAYFLSGTENRLHTVKQASAEHFTSNSRVLLGIGNRATSNAIELESAVLEQDIEIEQLAESDCFDRWVQQVASNYLSRRAELNAPLIRLTKGATGIPVRHFVSAAIAALTLGFCFWHWNYLQNRNIELLQKIEEVKQPAVEKKKYDSQLISILEQRAEVEKEDSALGDDLKRVQFFLENQSDRFSKLLAVIGEVRTNDLVIQQIDCNEEGVSLMGISLNGEAAQGLARAMREKTVPLGWVVNPARQEGQQKLTTGGPWNFEILLTDVGPFESAIKPRNKTNTLLKTKP